MITADDMKPGQEHSIGNQGKCITPQTKTFTIHWVGPNTVHYFEKGDPQLRDTSLDRFLEILNGQ